jgi:hypothetical protein
LSKIRWRPLIYTSSHHGNYKVNLLAISVKRNIYKSVLSLITINKSKDGYIKYILVSESVVLLPTLYKSHKLCNDWCTHI